MSSKFTGIGAQKPARRVNGQKNTQSTARMRATPKAMIGSKGSGLRGPNPDSICQC